MIEIPTTRGLTILADDEDADTLAHFSWYAVKVSGGRFYAHARVRGTSGARGSRILMHRFLLAAPPGCHVHHLNNNGLDNRRQNLAALLPTEHRSVHHYPNDTGVHMHKQTGRWRAQVGIGGKRLSIGLYADRSDALLAARTAKELSFQEMPQDIRGWAERINRSLRLSPTPIAREDLGE